MINGKVEALKNGGLRKSKFGQKARDYCLQFPLCQRWAKMIGETTQTRYFKELYRVCMETKKNPEDLINFKIEAVSCGQNPETRDKFFQCEQLLEKIINESEMKDKLMTKNAMVSFFKNAGVPLASNFVNWLEQKEKSEEEYRIIENAEEVEKIADYMKIPPQERNQAILWFLESTGIRRGTMPKLTFGDLFEVRHVGDQIKFYNWFDQNKEGDLDKEVPLMIDIAGEKLKGEGVRKYKGCRQVTFVHFRAYQEFLKYVEWLKTLKRFTYDKSGKHPIGKVDIEISPETPLFVSSHLTKGIIRPLDSEGFYARMTDAYILAKGNGVKYTPHDFKRFVETSLTVAWSGEKITDRTLPVQKIIDLIVAHKLTARDRAYIHANKDKILAVYKKALPFLVPKKDLEIKEKKEWIPEQPFRPVEIKETDATKLMYAKILELEAEIEKLKKQKS